MPSVPLKMLLETRANNSDMCLNAVICIILLFVKQKHTMYCMAKSFRYLFPAAISVLYKLDL